VLSKLVTPGVLHPFPLKKDLVPRSETGNKRGKHDYKH
jgi:hypothetical protein